MEQRSSPTNSEVRDLLESTLRTDADFMAFVQMNFPVTYGRFTNCPDRKQKINLLFEIEGFESVYEKLRQYIELQNRKIDCFTNDHGTIHKESSRPPRWYLKILTVLLAVFDYGRRLLNDLHQWWAQLALGGSTTVSVSIGGVAIAFVVAKSVLPGSSEHAPNSPPDRPPGDTSIKTVLPELHDTGSVVEDFPEPGKDYGISTGEHGDHAQSPGSMLENSPRQQVSKSELAEPQQPEDGFSAGTDAGPISRRDLSPINEPAKPSLHGATIIYKEETENRPAMDIIDVSYPLYVSKTLVTKKQYYTTMSMSLPDGTQEGEPLNRLSISDAMAYCNKLSKIEKLRPCYPDFRPDGFCGYRLPTFEENKKIPLLRGPELLVMRDGMYFLAAGSGTLVFTDLEQPRHIGLRIVRSKGAHQTVAPPPD